MIIMIYACDENNAIGKDGDLPWRQSTDLQHFKSITSGGTIVMGRKTWESLPGKLPNRRHVVLTRGIRTDVETATFDEIMEMAKSQDYLSLAEVKYMNYFCPTQKLSIVQLFIVLLNNLILLRQKLMIQYLPQWRITLLKNHHVINTI